jgi:hypothetical protein
MATTSERDEGEAMSSLKVLCVHTPNIIPVSKSVSFHFSSHYYLYPLALGSRQQRHRKIVAMELSVLPFSMVGMGGAYTGIQIEWDG